MTFYFGSGTLSKEKSKVFSVCDFLVPTEFGLPANTASVTFSLACIMYVIFLYPMDTAVAYLL